MAKDTLTPVAWIEAGLSELANHGPQALKAEPLARSLKTTKGSFYWHFKDVPAFHAAVLNHWQAAAFSQVVNLLEDEGPAADRLRRFGEEIQADPTDNALRAWAHSSEEVRNVIAQVDNERLKYLTALFSSIGVTDPDYAKAVYGSIIGMAQMGEMNGKVQKAYSSLVDLVLALR